jgi:hypothetical protein
MSDGRGGDLTRDILLRVRAQNLSTADFQQVTNSVNQLTAALDKQIEAASKGEIKERELTASLNKLGEAAKNLQGLGGQIEIFKGFETRLESARAAVERSKTTLANYQAELAKGEKAPANATARLEQLTRAHDREAASLVKLQADQTRYAESLQKAGIDVGNLAGEEQKLKTVADQIGAARTRLGAAQDNYAESVRKATAAAKAQADAERAAAKATEEKVKQQKEAAVAAERAAQAQAATNRKIEDDRAKAARDVEQGAAEANQPRYDRIKQQLERELAARSEMIERERRQNLGFTGRLREDLQQRLRDRQEYLSQLLRSHRQEQQAGAQAGGPPPPRPATGLPGARGATAPIGLFGLRPYELTNLGYQVNDVITGLSSGQRVGQVFAQQIGQVIQIFGLRFLSILPAATAGVAALAVAFGTLARSMQLAASNREFLGLEQFKVSSNYISTALTDVRKKIQDLGASWEEAGKVLGEARNLRLVPERLQQFGETAANVARITGKSIPDAAKEMAAAFSGSEQAIFKLNNELDFLTPKERDHIRQLFESGKAEEARAFALDKLSKKAQESADTMRGPWEKALLDMGKAWRGLLDALGNTAVFKAIDAAILANINSIKAFLVEVDKIKTKEDFWKWLLDNVLKGDLEALRRIGGGVPQDARVTNARVVDAITGAPAQPPAGGPGTAPVTDSRFRAGGLSLDSPQLQQLAQLLRLSSAQLPEGYSVEAISSFRKDARVAGTGLPSEHGFSRAIDVRIVDKNGNEVPGSMGVGGPLYQQLDKAMAENAAKLGFGPLAIGSTFARKPDAGHYSLGGEEAARNAARRGDTAAAGAPAAGTPVTTGPTPEQQEAIKNALRDEKERLAILRARSVEEELAKKREQYEREAREIGGDADQQRAVVEAKLAADRYAIVKRQASEEAEDRKQAIDDARNLTAITAARRKGEQEAIARGTTNYQDVREAGLKAAAVERDRLNTLDRENDAFKATKKSVDDLDKAFDTKHSTDLEKALEAVRIKYDQIREAIKKTQDQAKVGDKGRFDEQLARLPAIQAREERDVTQKSFESSAKVALDTRKELIDSYKRLHESGDITVAEQEEKTKKAIDATNVAIYESIAGLEKWLATAKEFGATDLEIEKVRAKVAELKSETKNVDPLFKLLKTTIEESFGSNLTTAFNTISQALGNLIAKTGSWKDVWTSLKTATANFFAGLLKDIAGAILKYEALKLLQSTGISGSGGFLASLLGTASQTGAGTAGAAAGGASLSAESVAGTTAGLFHQGGLVGAAGAMRVVPASWFAGAPRFHNGAMAGLAANEQAAILQRGEEVLTANNPRHARNWGGGGGGGEINIRNVLVADPDLVPAHMGSLRGERVIMNVLTKNAATVRQLVR